MQVPALARGSSAPDWASTPPPDLRGTAYTIVTTGGSAADVFAADWERAIPATTAVEWLVIPPTAPENRVRAAARDLAARHVVGWRLLATGDERILLILRAELGALGLCPAEMTLHATDVTLTRVYCPHCRTVTTTRMPADHTVTCTGCRRQLRVRTHFSRTLAAYLSSDAATIGKERGLRRSDDKHDQACSAGAERGDTKP